jgi:predicted dehydrogenase
MTRRDFLKTTAASAALTALSYSRVYGANSKLNHASIGVGGMGDNDLRNFLGHAKTQVVAICDVDKNLLGNAAKLAKDARKYQDWRELLAKEGDKID